MNIVIFLVIGAIAGWLAGLLVKGGGFGLIGNMIVGVVGAVVGGWALPMVGVSLGGLVGEVITATVGAVLLLVVVGLFRKGSG